MICTVQPSYKYEEIMTNTHQNNIRKKRLHDALHEISIVKNQNITSSHILNICRHKNESQNVKTLAIVTIITKLTIKILLSS